MWWLATALAGAPGNGDFESGLLGWSDNSVGSAQVQVVFEGGSFSTIGTDTTGLTFPSPTRAVLLRGGPGNGNQAARMESIAYITTHRQLQVSYHRETSNASTQVYTDDGVSTPLQSDLDGPSGTWVTGGIDAGPQCGTVVVFRVVQTAEVDRGFTLLDDVVVSDPCDQYRDLDLDGYCTWGEDLDLDGLCTGANEAFPSSMVFDCDDADPQRHVGATEIPEDGVDQDCDGADASVCFHDSDNDGFGGAVGFGPVGCDAPSFSDVGGDCDDLRGDVYPGADEICDGRDTNCDGIQDTNPVITYIDADGDAFGLLSTQLSLCGPLGDRVVAAGDCNDADASILPGATELPADGVDQNCDGAELCYRDVDHDGYAGPSTHPQQSLVCMLNQPNDCDDERFEVHPGAAESCDGTDGDCDGVIDDGLPQFAYFLDADDDGYGGSVRVDSCASPGLDYTTVRGDCADDDPAINPAVIEVPVDGVDQDCDGGDDCYRDADNDGYGTPIVVPSDDLTCSGAGLAENTLDCNDNRADVFPGAFDIIGNNQDEDCDGMDATEPGVDELEILLRGGAGCSVAAAGPTGWTNWASTLLRRR